MGEQHVSATHLPTPGSYQQAETVSRFAKQYEDATNTLRGGREFKQEILKFCDPSLPFDQQYFDDLVNYIAQQTYFQAAARFLKPQVPDPIERREVMAQ